MNFFFDERLVVLARSARGGGGGALKKGGGIQKATHNDISCGNPLFREFSLYWRVLEEDALVGFIFVEKPL